MNFNSAVEATFLHLQENIRGFHRVRVITDACRAFASNCDAAQIELIDQGLV